MILLGIPTGTDAPIYHPPIATVGLILANVACFVSQGFGEETALQPWALDLAVGHINPIEWLTTMFAHAGFGHLIGNMIFLWSFGLVVEGKIGWLRMLGLYLGIGISQAAFIQLIFLPWDAGYVVGASSAIMGLLAITMIWAPKNELGLAYFVWIFIIIRWGVLEITYMWIITGATLSTPALHLSGAMFGAAAGVLMLKKGWVDCENWDLFRVMSGNYGRFADSSTTVGSHADPAIMFGNKDVRVKEDLPDESHKAKSSKLFDKINTLIDRGDVITASEKMYDLRLKDSDSMLSEKRLRRLATGLLKSNMPDDAEIYVEEFLERFPDDCAWARVRMAQLQLTHHHQPRAALSSLKKVTLSALGNDLETLAKKIALTAKKQIQSGVEDAEPEW
jgi:membrane associated rhomboid family serine protease